MRIHRGTTAGAQPRGFSLLEVLIAVVVLSVGLLALAALQGSLTRSSADAKVRGRVAAMLSARIDDLRSNGYGTLLPEGAAAGLVAAAVTSRRSQRGCRSCGFERRERGDEDAARLLWGSKRISSRTEAVRVWGGGSGPGRAGRLRPR